MPFPLEEFGSFIASYIFAKGWGFTMSFFPAKIKVDELTCWRIEREEPPHHMWHHCYEYNFAGEISIIARIAAIITAFYLELPLRNGLTLRVESQMIPSNVLSKITPDEPITDNYFFQIRCETEIIVPSQAYVIMEFKRGKAKRKVFIKVDDEYRRDPFQARQTGMDK